MGLCQFFRSPFVHPSPLEAAHHRVLERRAQDLGMQIPDGGVELDRVPWGADEQATEPACMLIADYGELQAEYAAIRRATGVMDRVDRGLVELSGADALDLLSRLLTNAMPSVNDGVRGFFLQRNGRILADVLLVNRGETVLLDVDRTDAEALAEHLESFVFAEDVTILNCSGARQRIELYGPDGPELLAALATSVPEGLRSWRLDVGLDGLVGEPGVALDVPCDEAERLWEALLGTALEAKRPPRAIGWHAFNIARIEAGTPLFHIDFGPDTLPHETGILASRVSFTKGCYPGQEIVARMESRGKSKRRLVGLRVENDALPVAGSQVFAGEASDGGEMGEQIGLITSSTIAPMLGAAPVAFGMLRSAHAGEGTRVRVVADGAPAPATVSPLRFLKSRSEDA
jgi:folate-binding protein YgfZ